MIGVRLASSANLPESGGLQAGPWRVLFCSFVVIRRVHCRRSMSHGSQCANCHMADTRDRGLGVTGRGTLAGTRSVPSGGRSATVTRTLVTLPRSHRAPESDPTLIERVKLNG
jgi:hypothetical protein